MITSDTDPCELLLWDSEFFGFTIGRVRGDTLTPEQVKKIDLWCRRFKVRCLYFLARLDDPPTIGLAEAEGFHLVDVKMTLEWQGSRRLEPLKSVPLRTARKEDIPLLEILARPLYHNTRFFFDEQFPRPLSEALYGTWIRRSIEGYADQVLVAESDNGMPAGYISCHLEGNNPPAGRIGLVGVNRDSFGRKLGQSLLKGALDWFLTQEVKTVTVVTQGRNYAAQRLYQKFGFLTRSVQLWYHKWYGENNKRG